MIEKNPPKGVSFSDFICTFAAIEIAIEIACGFEEILSQSQNIKS